MPPCAAGLGGVGVGVMGRHTRHCDAADERCSENCLATFIIVVIAPLVVVNARQGEVGGVWVVHGGVGAAAVLGGGSGAAVWVTQGSQLRLHDLFVGEGSFETHTRGADHNLIAVSSGAARSGEGSGRHGCGCKNGQTMRFQGWDRIGKIVFGDT